MSEGCNNPNSATPRPWMLASNDPTIIVSERLDKSGDCFVIADVLNGMRHSTKEDEANAALIVHAVNNIDRITTERDGLLSEVECLNSNARVQAKLLADTGREKERLRKALETGTNKLGRVAAWLERLAIAAEKQAKDTRFLSLAEANAADAMNYRKTMDDLIPVIAEARKLLATSSLSDADCG